MSKKLKMMIFISSAVVVVLIIAILLLSLVGNVSSVEVYDFRVCQAPEKAVTATDIDNVYTFYLLDKQENNSHFFLSKQSETPTSHYVFQIQDENGEDVNGVVEIVNKEDGYYFDAKEVGDVVVYVYLETEQDGGIVRSLIAKDRVRVLKRLAIVNYNLVSAGNNRMPILIEQTTNGGKSAVSFASSNPEVAKVVSYNDSYYVEFYKAGNTKITAYASSNQAIRDYFDVNVNGNEPNDLKFVDADGNEVTQKTIYTDGQYYEVNYQLFLGEGGLSSEDGDVNCENIEIADYSHVPIWLDGLSHLDNGNDLPSFDGDDGSVLSAVGNGLVLDKDNRVLKIKRTDNDNFADALAYITLQTYTQTDGENHITGTYSLPIVIKKLMIKALQLEVSNKPEFSDTEKVVYTTLSDEEVQALPWPKTADGKTVNVTYIDKIYLTNNEVHSFYYKLWAVFNNSNRELIDPNSGLTSNSNDGILEIVDGEHDQTTNVIEYYVAQLKNATARVGKVIHFEFTYDSTTLVVGALSEVSAKTDGATDSYVLSLSNVMFKDPAKLIKLKLYEYDSESGAYNFIYWDDRLRSPYEITDASGRVIGFAE
ncbi:MAG: hypothetical protein IJS68_00505 [Clostridia bacterium]|nr:hypothetical protein [Clostridia bacterium]